MKPEIKTKLKTYFQSNSKLKVASDFFFYLLILLLLIPATRREIMTTVRRLTMMKPSVVDAPALSTLNESDYLFRFENQEGNFLSLADYKGDVLFVNFWATWCPPCRAEMPSIQKLYDDYKNDVRFLMITGEQPEPVNKYLESNNYTFPVLYQRSELPSSFMVSAIPHTYVIDQSGKILMSKTGAARWDSQEFRDYLNKLLK